MDMLHTLSQLFLSLPLEKSRHWVSFWEFIAICWWHFRDHCAYLTNSQMEANSLFWPLKPKILLISSLTQKSLFVFMCWDYRQANLIFCIGKIRIGLFERFVVLNFFYDNIICVYTQAIECCVHVLVCLSVCKNCEFGIIDFAREKIHF